MSPANTQRLWPSDTYSISHKHKHKNKRNTMSDIVERDFDEMLARDVEDLLYSRSDKMERAIFERYSAPNEGQ